MPLSNILDPIHPTLTPLLWDRPESTHPVLKPQHAQWIKKRIYTTLTQAGYTDVEKWLKLCLTGSLTTYQYSDQSDVDMSLFIDSEILPEWSRAEMIGLMVSKIDGTTLPGTPFPLQDFVVARTLKPKDLYKEGLRSAYDLDLNAWIVPPEPSRSHDVQIEQNGFYAYALEVADKMERLLRYEPDKAIQFWHQLHKRRMRDQSAGKGDYSESNIVYKFLANRGLFDSISAASGEYIAKTAAGDWFAPSYMVPDDTKQQIHAWTQGLPWPEGSDLSPPERYHVTGLYSPSGFRNPSHHEWVNSRSGLTYPVQTTGLESFDAGVKGHPVVLRVHHPQLEGDTERLMGEAEQQGIPISRHPSGYKPHITIGYSPTPIAADHPHLTFPIGPLCELHSYYDELGKRVAKTAEVDPKIGAWHDHFVNQIQPLADAYERLPMYDPTAAKAWQSLADDSMKRAAEIGQRLNVQVTDEPEPYANAQEMFNDINRGNFQVSRANSEHPIWTPEQNVAFRTTHDVLGHHPSGGDFSWNGENQACARHFPLLTPEAQKALMVECLGQTGYAIHRGGFGPQKVGFMDQFLSPAQQAYNKGTFSAAPVEGFCHRHIRHGIHRLTNADSWSIMDGHEGQETHRGAHRQTLGQSPQGDGQAQIEPFFPDLNTAVEANQAALSAHGQTNHALLRPEVLEGALGRAQNHYHYTGSMADAAAALAHGVGQSQAFEDGNKRTAYWLTHHFLRENGYGPEIMPDDDEELADHLVGYGEGTHSLENTADMFRQRGQGRIASAREMAKFVYDPHTNRLILGEMGADEGEKPTHRELALSHFTPEEFMGLKFGHVADNGLVETYGRPTITGGGEAYNPNRLNPYQAQWMTEEAVRRTLPNARPRNPQENYGSWQLPSEPEVSYMGQVPSFASET